MAGQDQGFALAHDGIDPFTSGVSNEGSGGCGTDGDPWVPTISPNTRWLTPSAWAASAAVAAWRHTTC